jgi:asparagine synthase (glutamine-hydrolysing)
MEKLIAEHLQSKQKVAINLSGGLDSSLLAHEMRRVGHEINSYTTIFANSPDQYNIDAMIARRFSKDYGTNHHEIHVTKNSYFENLIDSYEYIEEPNYNISLPIYLQTAKAEGIRGDNNRVVLSGDGGDEVFGGYSYYFKGRETGQYKKFLTPFLFSIIKNYRNKTDFDFTTPEGVWLFYKFFTKQYITKEISEARNVSKAYITESMRDLKNLYKDKNGPVYDLMFLDRFTWLAGENFIRSDKLYMSQSLEMRCPLSYHPLRTYFDTTLSEKDYLGQKTNKAFLRQKYNDLLPEYVVHRKDKSGWRAPIAEWYDKKFKDLFMSIIPNVPNKHVAASMPSIIDWYKVRNLVESSESWPGKYAHLYLSLAILKKKYTIDL